MYRAACFLRSTPFGALSCWRGEAVSFGRACSSRHLCACLPTSPSHSPSHAGAAQGRMLRLGRLAQSWTRGTRDGPDYTAHTGGMHLQPMKKLW